MTITTGVTIIGPVAGITITRSQDPSTPDFRIFQLSTSSDFPVGTHQVAVRLENLTITGGVATDHKGGGGILDSGQVLAVVGCTIEGNSSNGKGGGIAATTTVSSLIVQATSIVGNSTETFGGGIFSSSPLTLSASTLSGNSALSGGALSVSNSTATSVVNTTFQGNSATSLGGAVYAFDNTASTFLITASTITENSASTTLGSDGVTQIQNGGGLFGAFTLTDTIVALNSNGDWAGSTSSTGEHNLIGDGSGGLDPSTNLLNIANPGLGPLQDNGGLTKTMVLLPGSPAIGAGVSVTGLNFDQRFAARPAAGAVDLGAFQTGSERPSFVVNTTADTVKPTDGLTSLREAITYANNVGAFETITFDPTVFDYSRTITLNPALGQLTILDDVSIIGPSAGVTIARDPDPTTPDFRIFSIPRTPEIIQPQATVQLDHLTITGGNSGLAREGGGIDCSTGTIIIIDCTISNNTSGYEGGGIYAGFAQIVASTIANNSADFSGGGICVTQFLLLSNSTIANNISSGSSGGAFINSGTISDSTIVGNSSQSGGAIRADTHTTINNSIIANNIGGDIEGTITGQGNFIGDGSGGLDPTQNLVGYGDPGLGPLQNNGGPTETMALLPGSPALNEGEASLLPSGLTTDQRGQGFPRLVGDGLDIGAYEAGTPAAIIASVSSQQDFSNPCLGSNRLGREARARKSPCFLVPSRLLAVVGLKSVVTILDRFCPVCRNFVVDHSASRRDNGSHVPENRQSPLQERDCQRICPHRRSLPRGR